MTDDERIERDLHATLSRRDPGPAPERLRARVAEVPMQRRTGRPWLHTLIGVARPVAATIATAAAIVVGILIVSVVRPGPGPSAGQSPVPGPIGAGSGPDLGTVGAPPAIPVDVAVVGLLVVLLIVFWNVESMLVSRARNPLRSVASTGRRRMSDRVPRRWWYVGITLALLLGGSASVSDAKLGLGSMFQASLVHLEGLGQVATSLGTGSGEAAFFRYVPGSTVTVVQAVRNTGHLPVTILGVGETMTGVEPRLFAPQDPSASVDVDTMPTYRFAPIELAPGQERPIAFVFHVAACPGVTAPSSEPSPDVSGDYVPPTTGEAGAFMSFDRIDLDYSVLGLARETAVPFFETVVIRSQPAVVCTLDQEWDRPSPSAP